MKKALVDPAVLPTRRKKVAASIKALERTKWHQRQRPREFGEVSKNQQFRDIKIPTHVLSFIKNHNLGRFRPPKGSRSADKKEEEPDDRSEQLFSRHTVKFLGSAATPSSFLPETLPEVALLGRSNVGKSSLINGLTGTNKAKTSHTPGYTRTINFFELGKALRLVDLPGYGFAYAGDEKMNDWQSLVREYLRTRKTLKRVCLLIDSRHGLKPHDLEVLEMFESEKRPYQIVMTKSELVDQVDLARRYVQTLDTLANRKLHVNPIVPCSSHKRQGLELLRTQLRALAAKLPVIEKKKKEKERREEPAERDNKWRGYRRNDREPARRDRRAHAMRNDSASRGGTRVTRNVAPNLRQSRYTAPS